MRGRVLVVAGSDSGGGAGIQADIKAILAMGAHASTALTALTAQNTLGVSGVRFVEPEFVRAQMVAVLSDIGADVVKTGMLGRADTIQALLRTLDEQGPHIPLVVDPVMVAKGGARLLDDAAVAALVDGLLPRAALLTPNLPEAEALTGHAIADEAGMHQAIKRLRAMGGQAVLLKGGHLPGPYVLDILATQNGTETFRSARIETRHTHGTGCTLASAIAAGMAQGMDLRAAVRRARAYVQAAILGAPGLGAGHGPMGHDVTVDPDRLDWEAPQSVVGASSSLSE